MKKPLYFLSFFFLIAFSCKENRSKKNIENKSETVHKSRVKTIQNQPRYYKLRTHAHIEKFYKNLAKQATQICLDNNIPPAALLAIASLESGWDSGYVGQITGNILSLGAHKSDTELPALRLPRLLKTNRILFDSLEIIKYKDSELRWENRPESLKKDYRPKPWAGTQYRLAYLKHHPKEKKAAQLANITDFVTVFIGRKSGIKVYRTARKKMDSLVAKHGKKILLKESVAINFVYSIGGKRNSYNYRKTWPKKVVYILKNAGLASLTTRLHEGEKFEAIW